MKRRQPPQYRVRVYQTVYGVDWNERVYPHRYEAWRRAGNAVDGGAHTAIVTEPDGHTTAIRAKGAA